jgi:hypothetical protein
MLNWINDPAALRQIVQNVRPEANPQPQAAVIAVAKPEQNTASSNAQPAASANTNVVIQSAATAQQAAAAAMQFQSLEESLAARGIQQASPAANPSGTATQQGQLPQGVRLAFGFPRNLVQAKPRPNPPICCTLTTQLETYRS